MKKTILSFDVGIKNLAYCVIEKNNDDFNIKKWGIINLSDDRQKCEILLKGEKECNKDAKEHIICKGDDSFIGQNNEKYVCSSHLKKATSLVVEMKEKKEQKNKKNKIEIVKKKCIQCNTDAKYELSTNAFFNTNFYWCDEHVEKAIKNVAKNLKVKKITNLNCNKQPIQNLSEKLFKKLDESCFMDIDEILIENQPSLRNPTMKTISTLLYSYFILRGIIDKEITNSNITLVKFVSPSNKLKVDKKTTESLLKKENIDNSKNKKEKYKITKNLGIKYCNLLIQEKDKKILDNYKKKDDMCDAFLQGFQYLFSPIPQKYIDKLLA